MPIPERQKSRLSSGARQADIIQIVLTLTAQQSPADITTMAIAKAIGLTQGAVFRHFPTKEAIWLSVLDWVRRSLLSRIEDAAQSVADPLAALRAAFAAHVQFIKDQPGVPRIIFHELQQPGDSPLKQQVREILRSHKKIVMTLLQTAQQQGQIDTALQLESASTLFLGAIQGLAMQAMAAGATADLQQLSEGVLEVLLSGVERR
ncbi:TetR/AcrR family transcriptional regulator [Herminiimonas sp. CN]|uniref:TetR/AcrR family transcriptional regulator n=1 Tax=Herminiimonas sp. CN TaxID=1349818 RepID=UPI0005589F84|nr:TetR/AcrR family transcriptional regulator [Herminiimonas sp. CN]